MLKEYNFNISYECYPFRSKKESTKYSVNDHKVSAELYYTILDKVMASMPLDHTSVFYWRNHKTGSYTRSVYNSYNEETYDYE